MLSRLPGLDSVAGAAEHLLGGGKALVVEERGDVGRNEVVQQHRRKVADVLAALFA